MFSLDVSWVALLVTGFATMFLFGEMLVNMRGMFGVLGVGFISVYFLSYLSPSMFIVTISVYVLSLLLIIIDAKVVNDGTLTTIGGIFMLITVGISAPDWVTGIYGIVGVVLGAFGSLMFLKVFPKRNMWSKITLLDSLTTEAGYSTMNETYSHLVGKQGVTVTDLRPVGNIRIDDHEYSAISNGQWISKGESIMVESVDGTKILVKRCEN